MALIKKGFKKFGHEDVRTTYKACDATHKAPAEDNADLVNGPLNLLEGCLPAGAVIKFNANIAVSAEAGDITDANINKTVFLLAEDFYSNDNGFVYYIVDNVANLEDRA